MPTMPCFPLRRRALCTVALLLLTLAEVASGGAPSSGSRGHNNNWAVIVDTSRFWFNYRHAANVLGIYRTIKKLGIPDDQIIVMLADDAACDPRNPHRAQIFNDRERPVNVYDDYIEVDYRGTEVTEQSFMRMMTGRYPPETPASKRLNTNSKSNILVYMTGHGGDEFLKFQDATEISANDLADTFQQMHEQGRYNEILFMTDTCQAGSLGEKLSADGTPNVVSIGSARKGENSYSGQPHKETGNALMDRFTYHTLEFFEHRARMDEASGQTRATLRDLFGFYDPQLTLSHATVRADLYPRALGKVPLTDFFGQVLRVRPTSAAAGGGGGGGGGGGYGLLAPNADDDESTNRLERMVKKGKEDIQENNQEGSGDVRQRAKRGDQQEAAAHGDADARRRTSTLQLDSTFAMSAGGLAIVLGAVTWLLDQS